MAVRNMRFLAQTIFLAFWLTLGMPEFEGWGYGVWAGVGCALTIFLNKRRKYGK
jgi:hypothetical protein